MTKKTLEMALASAKQTQFTIGNFIDLLEQYPELKPEILYMKPSNIEECNEIFKHITIILQQRINEYENRS